MVTYQEESWTQIEEELKELFPEHWEETEVDKYEIELNPDYELYQTLDKLNKIQVITVRENKKLIGYHISLLSFNMHSKKSFTAFTDSFFIKKEFRKGQIGIKLFQYMEKKLKEKNVQKIYVGTKFTLDLSRLFEYLNYKPVEKIYSKLLIKE